eukprot:COSAG02_NODE_4793_length_4973_cov_2.768158_4_plen_441_part_00
MHAAAAAAHRGCRARAGGARETPPCCMTTRSRVVKGATRDGDRPLQGGGSSRAGSAQADMAELKPASKAVERSVKQDGEGQVTAAERRHIVGLPQSATEDEVTAVERRRIVGLPLSATEDEVTTAEEKRLLDYKPGKLREAARNGDTGTMQKFLDAGVDPNDERELLASWSPLHYAAQLGHVEAINLLLDHGAKPAPLDKFGETPIMQAGYWDQAAAIEVLLRRGGGSKGDVPASMVVKETPALDDWLDVNGVHDMKDTLANLGVGDGKESLGKLVQMVEDDENKLLCALSKHRFGKTAEVGEMAAKDDAAQAKFVDAIKASSDVVKAENWKADGHVTIICSAPEFSLTRDKVMVALFALCDMNHTHVKFGYDWGKLARWFSLLSPSDLCVHGCHRRWQFDSGGVRHKRGTTGSTVLPLRGLRVWRPQVHHYGKGARRLE